MIKSSPQEQKKQTTEANELISQIIGNYSLKKSTTTQIGLNNSPEKEAKLLIDYLESLMKTLQRCHSKPELKKDLLQEERINSFVNTHPEALLLLIKQMQKKIAELKTSSNASFSANISVSPFTSNMNTPSGMVDNPSINYFFIDALCDSDEFLRPSKLNFTFLIIISPFHKHIDLITFSEKINLNYQHINSLLNNKVSYMDQIFQMSPEDYIEEKEVKLPTYKEFTHSLNLLKIIDEAAIHEESKVNFPEYEISISNFKLNKMIIAEHFFENLKTIVVKNSYHQNLIHTNNLKLIKSIFENELNYFCSANQIVQV